MNQIQAISQPQNGENEGVINEVIEGLVNLNLSEPGEVKEGAISANFELLPHQKEAVAWIKSREEDEKFPCGILGMVMGLGKTFTTLQYIANNRVPNEPTLIVCPKTALYTWKSEIQKFFNDRLKVFIYRKDETKIDEVNEQILRSYDIVLTNFEYIRSIDTKYENRLIESIKEVYGKNVNYNVPQYPVTAKNTGDLTLFSMRWYRIVADESHNFSKIGTSLWKSMLTLCGTRRLCLTGTPIRNLSDDIYSQFKWLGYRDEFIDPQTFVTSFNTKSFIHYIDYNVANIRLPEVHHERIKINLYGYQEKLYNLFVQRTKNMLQNFNEKKGQFIHVLTTFLRLRQICVSPYTITPQSSQNIAKLSEQELKDYESILREFETTCPGIIKWLHDKNTSSGLDAEKIVRAVDIISKIPKGEKVVVFTMFRRAINLIVERMLMHTDKKAVCIDSSLKGQDRDKELNDFKTSDKDVMFVTYKIGAESLNLTEANHIILLEGWWCPAVIEQAKSRIHRMGQKKDIHIYELIIGKVGIEEKESIEMKMAEICQKKIEHAKNYLENGVCDNFKLDAKLIKSIL